LIKRTWTAAVVVIAALLCGAPIAHARYPERLIRLIVPVPAGGLIDGVARVLQPALQEELGQTVIIDNRPGASGTIGTDAVAKAAPDGYTLLVVASSHSVAAATTPKLPYDAERDLAAVGMLVADPLLFVVSAGVRANTLGEFIALAKADPGKLTYATPGPASQSSLVTELFAQRTGLKMLEIPYRGGAPAMLGLVAGDVQFGVFSMQLSAPQIESGKVRALATGGRERATLMPAIPTLAEAGITGMDATQWVGMLAPAQTPPDVIATLNGALARILDRPETKAKLATQGLSAARSTPEDFARLISAEIKQWGELAQKTRER